MTEFIKHLRSNSNLDQEARRGCMVKLNLADAAMSNWKLLDPSLGYICRKASVCALGLPMKPSTLRPAATSIPPSERPCIHRQRTPLDTTQTNRLPPTNRTSPHPGRGHRPRKCAPAVTIASERRCGSIVDCTEIIGPVLHDAEVCALLVDVG